MRLPPFSAAVLCAALLAMPVPAPAAPTAGFSDVAAQAQSSNALPVQKVRYRGYYHHRHSNAGAVAAGTMFGLALGAIIGSQAARYNAEVEWCIRHYRSYDVRTHTWVDYHGRIHTCP